MAHSSSELPPQGPAGDAHSSTPSSPASSPPSSSPTAAEHTSLADLRREYLADGLEREHLLADPIAQFSTWMEAAVATAGGALDPTAMTLATASREGRPSARVVLLKGVGSDGFRFFTNYGSDKAEELDENPRAALCFFWPELARQVRVEGRARRLAVEESRAYFHSRPVASQLGSWASPQSEVLPDRATLDARFEEVTRRFAGQEVPLPDFWGGYLVEPESIEFWQGRPSRLHDRFRYTRVSDGSWRIDRLAP